MRLFNISLCGLFLVIFFQNCGENFSSLDNNSKTVNFYLDKNSQKNTKITYYLKNQTEATQQNTWKHRAVFHLNDNKVTIDLSDSFSIEKTLSQEEVNEIQEQLNAGVSIVKTRAPRHFSDDHQTLDTDSAKSAFSRIHNYRVFIHSDRETDTYEIIRNKQTFKHIIIKAISKQLGSNPRVCSPEDAPVCGIDGKTYLNKCHAEKIEIAHNGPCNPRICPNGANSTTKCGQPQPPVAPKPPKLCPHGPNNIPGCEQPPVAPKPPKFCPHGPNNIPGCQWPPKLDLIIQPSN